ncbi:DHS-like NAD/FAD-binding domain-containing protein [Xylariales sp. PMI_506]|nr:DHS-like NAD/FAD-binding domain-containing protein [Xylariales sp. PMI_506]
MRQAKRRPGRPKSTAVTKTRKTKIQIKVKEISVQPDQEEVSHLTEEELLHHDESDPVSELHERVNDLGESWETESLFEDVIEDMAEDKIFVDVENACNPEEAVKYRQMLRAVGPEEFCKATILAGSITAKKLLTAFGIRPPAFLEGQTDDAYYSLLTLALTRELSKRAKLMEYNTVDDAVSLLQRSKNIIVLTGAGISTSLGIPDFRSKETGLYSQLAKLGLAINDPQEVFNIDVFRDDPTIFFTVAKDILPNTKKFTPTHAFIAMLQNKGKLLTNYSQNIDNIEANAGILPEKLVQCHGSFATATCRKCGYKVIGETIFNDIKDGKIPRCEKCLNTLRAGPVKRKRSKRSSSGKRSRYNSDDTDDDGDFDIPEAGVMKPDITFFGEPLPNEFHNRLVKHDKDRVDLVVVIGTSLKVAPVSEVVPYLPPHIPQIYISRTPVGHINFDIDLLGDCDVVVSELCRRAGWDLDHEMIPPNQKVRTVIQDGYCHRHVFTTIEKRELPEHLESGSLTRDKDE